MDEESDDYFDPDKLDFPVALVPGQQILIQCRDEGSRPVTMLFHAAEGCGTEPDPNIPKEDFPAKPHLYTICDECLPIWALDYYITEITTIPGL